MHNSDRLKIQTEARTQDNGRLETPRASDAGHFFGLTIVVSLPPEPKARQATHQYVSTTFSTNMSAIHRDVDPCIGLRTVLKAAVPVRDILWCS